MNKEVREVIEKIEHRETHSACQEKLKKYGGKSTCCECIGCEFCIDNNTHNNN